MNQKYLLARFKAHRKDAKRRRIGFLLTFEQWLHVWQVSGHLAERGQGMKKYCMARFGDKGPYALNNVKIITNAANLSERKITAAERALRSQASAGANNYMFGRTHTKSAKAKISASAKGNKRRLGAKLSAASKAKIGKANGGKNSAWFGRRHSAKTIAKMRRWRRNYYAEKRACVS